MIRRDITAEDGRPAWLLVPQIDHAELAGRLADVWRLEGLLPALRPAEIMGNLRTAVHRHDDGWLDWDARPGIDPKLGRPVNFDEMRLADSLAIWSRSIVQAAARGPLIGYFVAGHFTRLLRRFDSWRNDPAMECLAREFLTEYDDEMDRWLGEQRQSQPASADRRHEQLELARRGVSYLQLFDAISLWLCCAERQEPWRVEMAGGENWTFSPVASAVQGRPQVRIEPWPLGEPECELAVRGRVVPRAHYASTDDLVAATIADDVKIGWRLVG